MTISLFRHASRLRKWNAIRVIGLTQNDMSVIVHQINNLLCEPPLENDEIDKVLASAFAYPVSAKTEERDEKKPSQAEMLIELGERLCLFHDDINEAYAEVSGQNAKIRGSIFKHYLARMLWQERRKAPNSDALNQALSVLEAKALHEGEKRVLHNRVAFSNGVILYDLGDGRAVRISPDHWEIVPDPSMIFKRYSHQQAQVEPKPGGELYRIFDYINILEEEHQFLTIILLLSYFIPEIAHPIAHLYGDHGSGKTTFSVIFKRLLDPSKLPVFFAPRDLGETIQILEHHYFVCFDNLSGIPGWLSDLLAQAVTGAGLSKRKLYTDDEDVIFQLRRCIAVNGINQLIHRPDMMDRSVLLRHSRIDPSRRRSERELMSQLEDEVPYILGAIFDALSKTMALFPGIALPELPRMADFALWGCAIAEALGYSQGSFMEAYLNNIRGQNNEIIAGNTLAQAVFSFMYGRANWSGTMGQAYKELSDLATPVRDDKTFPKAPNKLRDHLERIKPVLSENGVIFNIADKNTVEGVMINFQRIGDASSRCSYVQECGENNDLDDEDILNMPEEEESSSENKTARMNAIEGPEHTEDKNINSWEGIDDGTFIPELDLPGTTIRLDLGSDR